MNLEVVNRSEDKMATETIGSTRLSSPIFKTAREFRSLDSDMGLLCLSSGNDDYHSLTLCEDHSLTRQEVSASLPNLAQNTLFLALTCAENRDYRKSCCDFSTDPTNDGKGSLCKDRTTLTNKDASKKGMYEKYSSENCTDLAVVIKSNIELNNKHVDLRDEQSGTNISISDHVGFDVSSICTSCVEHSLKDNHSVDCETCPANALLQTLPNNELDTVNDDFVLEKTDELTLLKESPRSSPGNTLDSGVCSLGRTDSFGRTDASSFSSVSSISVECAATVDSEMLEEDCDTNNLKLCEEGDSTDCTSETVPQKSEIEVTDGTKPKRKTLTLSGFLSRSLFSRKNKEDVGGCQAGWRLFGKTPQVKAVNKEESSLSTDSMKPNASLPATSIGDVETESGKKVKKTDIEVLSTTALILEHRPSGLPCKDPEEQLKHKQQYEQMIEAAKRKEMKEVKQRKKQLQQQLKHEDEMAAAVKIWNTELLSSWESMHNSKKARDLWWNGIPPSVRGKVWKLAFGNDLNLTKDLYRICLNRAKERLKLIEDWCGDTDSICSYMSGFSDHSASREASVELIKLDVSRTFPQLCIFQKGGPYHELLQGLLGAYACYRPDVGYVQGMSFIAAVLLLNMEVEDAFICFANLLNRPCQIAFFRLDEYLMRVYFDTYEEFFEDTLPALYDHFKQMNITSDLYIIDWMFTLYAKSLPLDIASRVWDMFARDGEEFLFRTALGILKLYEDILINMDFIHLAQFLTRLPEHIQSDQLFNCLDKIKMQIDTRRFKDVLASYRDANKDHREQFSYS